LWVEALRSGEFKQTTSHLTAEVDGELHCCCLGVACEIIRRVEGEHVLTREVSHEHVRYDEQGSVLPVVVQKWLGFATSVGEYGPKQIGHSFRDYALSSDNDSRNYTFDQIADVIESAPEGLLA
jgi:hypothetical protein